jgi:hypothetical protein
MLFLVALISFVIFAWNQDVNLVHEDYYEKGVDHSAQMEKESRSALFNDLITLEDSMNAVLIRFPGFVAQRIDSGKVLFFRPSDHKKDIVFRMDFRDSLLIFGKEGLIPGRYTVKMSWYSGGIDFEVDKMIVIK